MDSPCDEMVLLSFTRKSVIFVQVNVDQWIQHATRRCCYLSHGSSSSSSKWMLTNGISMWWGEGVAVCHTCWGGFWRFALLWPCWSSESATRDRRCCQLESSSSSSNWMLNYGFSIRRGVAIFHLKVRHLRPTECWPTDSTCDEVFLSFTRKFVIFVQLNVDLIYSMRWGVFYLSPESSSSSSNWMLTYGFSMR